MIKLKDLLPHISNAIECVIFFDNNDEYEYIFDLDDYEGLNKWSECVLIDWEIKIDRINDNPFLYVTNWK